MKQAATGHPIPAMIYVLFVLFASAIFLSSLLIAGPFIFGDEAGYFDLARSVALEGEFGGAQYNPLYPLLLSPFFYFSNPVVTYLIAKAINALAFASIVFPLYVIASRLIPGRRAAMLATAVASLMPAGAYSYVIVAEALYFPLVAWAFAALMLYQEKPCVNRGVFLALAITLAYFAKQAGYLILPAMFIALTIDAWREKSADRPRLMKLHTLVFVLGSFGPLLWTIRNRINHQGGGGVGYQEGWNRLAVKLEDWPDFVLDCINNVFYSFSYLTVALYGALFVIFIWALVKWQERTRQERVLLASLLLFTAGLMALSAVFFTAYGMQDYPNGRYFDAVTPIMVIFALAQFWSQSEHGRALNVRHKISAALIVATLVTIFSPLDVLFAYTFINNASFSFLHQLFMPYPGIIWSPYKGVLLERVLVGAGVGMTTLILLAIPFKRLFIAALVAIQLTVSTAAYANVILLSQQVAAPNRMYKSLASKGLLRSEGEPSRVVYDRSLESDQMMYFHRFWFGEMPRYVDAGSIVHRYAFDFGVAAVPAIAGMRKVPAPWRPESTYDKPSGRAGFLDIRSLDGVSCGAASADRVIATSTVKFRIDLPPGRYQIRLLAKDPCPTSVPVKFTVHSATLPHRDVGAELRPVHDVSRVEEVGTTGLVLEFIPKDGALVMLDQLIVERIDTSQKLNNLVFVTSADLHLTELVHEGNLRAYAVP